MRKLSANNPGTLSLRHAFSNEPLLEGILRPLGGAERTSLDFACGTGRIAEVAAMFFGSVVGVDVSEAMLSAASVPDNVTLLCVDHLSNRHLTLPPRFGFS